MATTEHAPAPLNARTTMEEAEELITAALEVLGKLEGPDPLPAEEIPGRGEAIAWFREVFTAQGGRLRQRKSLAKGSSRQARGLAGLLRWHHSGGNLDGLFIARFNAGADFDRVATLASVIMALAGSSSSATAAWRRTGLIGGPS